MLNKAIEELLPTGTANHTVLSTCNRQKVI